MLDVSRSEVGGVNRVGESSMGISSGIREAWEEGSGNTASGILAWCKLRGESFSGD
jgi:hypothetical protein